MHLYTMRTPLAADFRGTLEQLADIGYATVGVSGRHGNDAAAIRAMLDATRLRAVLEHVGYDTVRGSGLPRALDDLHTLGARWIVVPSLPGALHTPAGFREAAREFNKAGLAARNAGLGPLLFHNHGDDHKTVDGEVLYDILLKETDPELVGFELDVYWAAKGAAATPRTSSSATAAASRRSTSRTWRPAGLRGRRLRRPRLRRDVRHRPPGRRQTVARRTRRPRGPVRDGPQQLRLPGGAAVLAPMPCS
ncbi:sugar phosphate isomerase/epimerase family protein [Streptomyces zhihengii]